MTWIYIASFCMGMSTFCQEVVSTAYGTKTECDEKLAGEIKQWVDLGWTVRLNVCRKSGMKA